jgi:two-component system sensor histidine kinase GlrK
MYTLFFRPRSLLQLVIIAFVLVLAPLGALLVNAIQALEGISLKGRIATMEIASLAKSSQSLPEIVLDMEHAARQYQVLGVPKLKGIYRLSGRRFSAALDSICRRDISEQITINCSQLNAKSKKLIETLNSATYNSKMYEHTLDDFKSLTKHNQQFVQQIQTLIEQRSEQLASDAEKVKSQLLWQSIGLVPLSILLSMFFTYLITRPIQRLEKIIQELGSGKKITKFRVYGPKELSNLGEKLNWLQTRLQRLETEKLSFVRQMSHELKTPLSSIREGADLLEEENFGALTVAQREIVNILQEKGLQLQRIIENLLDFNALKYQRELHTTQFDLYKLIDEVLFEHRLDFQKAKLHYCLDGHSQNIFADRIKLRTLLSNLISNSIYYSTLPARTWISWKVSDDSLILEIANHGKSIPLEDQKRIFLPFEQGSQPRSGTIKGSGIGLSVALECALLHQGSLKLVKHSQAEVCFQLLMPLTRD